LQRIAPGEKNTWYLDVLGTKVSARFSTREPKRLDGSNMPAANRFGVTCQTGHETAFKTITGPIFEFGAPDAILQMWAAFVHELVEATH